MYRYMFGILLFIFLASYTSVIGQSVEGGPNISLEASPSDPEPGESVSFTLSSYETNLDLANIKWSYGSQTKSGYGEKEFTITAPSDTSKIISVTVDATLSDGKKISKNMSVAVTSFDISWEAIGAKNIPFYMGKKIPIRENNIRVAVISPNDTGKPLAYTWTKNGKSIQSNSSSKTFVDFKNSEINKTESVSATISSATNNSTRDINIPFTKPSIFFYEYSPLTGLNLAKIIVDTALGYEGTTNVLAIPRGLNTNKNPSIKWTLSGVGVNNQQNPYMLSFGVPDEKGSVPLSVKIEDLSSVYQNFSGLLNLIF